MSCKKCGGEDFRITEQRTNLDGSVKYRRRCKMCGHSKTLYEYPSVVSSSKKYVITSCQNDTDIHDKFYRSILNYANINGCEVVVLKTTSLTAENLTEDPVWAVNVVDTAFDIENSVRVLGSLRITNTTLNPLAGLDDLVLGKHLIVGNNQLQMKTTFAESVEKPIFIYSTGTISRPKYSTSKAGFKAARNHTYSFLFVEVRNDKTFIRDIVSDESGCFYDIGGYYEPDSHTPLQQVSAVVTGDEHAVKIDPSVLHATYMNSSSIIKTLKPKYIIRHDVLDFYSGSHHHEHDFILRYKKSLMNEDCVETELLNTFNHIILTTPDFAKNIIVESNHNEHLRKWLNLFDPKRDIKNSRLYFGLMYQIMQHIENGDHISPFEAYCKMKFGESGFIFTHRDSPIEVSGVEISYHGDRGVNGSRGSVTQFSKTYKKFVIGHSHSPKIEKGCYQVGTSTSRLEYATGLTTWSNSHCIIYPNGQCQLVSINLGEWK